jgi:hypothetical protein
MDVDEFDEIQCSTVKFSNVGTKRVEHRRVAVGMLTHYSHVCASAVKDQGSS